MKLKKIPSDTVVYAPTEAEAKELLAILHENGYEWGTGDNLLELTNWNFYKQNTCYYMQSPKQIVFCRLGYARKITNAILTLSEFKERCVDFDDTFTDDCKSSVKVEKPQLKDVDHAIVCNGFNKDGIKDGDKVFVFRWDSENFAAILNTVIGTIIPEKNLEPYIKPETKSAEEMETKELNLCELIGDRDGIHVYSPTCGEVTLQAWDRGKNTKPLIFAQKDTNIVVRTFANGKAYAGGECCIYPSRELYEQYPLDAAKAWMKWQEEQKKYTLAIVWNCPDRERSESIKHINFRLPADRDKCIEEIQAIVEKYSKKQNQ